MRQLKIAFLMTQFPIPGGLFIYDRIIGLLNLGHEVLILAKSPATREFPLHESLKRYKLTQRVDYFGAPGSFLAVLKVVLSDLAKHPVFLFKCMVKSLRVSGGGRFVSTYFAIRALSKHEHIDIFFGMSGPTSQQNLFLKTLYPQAKFAANFYGFDFSSRIRKQGPNIYQSLFKQADLMISQSYYSRDCVIALGCPEYKIIKHPFGVNPSVFSFHERKVDEHEGLRFITVARLIEKKGHRLILTAISNLIRRGRKLTYHIVGDGPLLHDILGQIESDSHLKGNVIYHGYKTQFQIAEILCNCHVFLHPSVTTLAAAAQEDTPTTLLEAQATGMPVIATYHAGIPEIVKHNVTGLLVPERNVYELEKAIDFFIHNPHECSLMGAAAREFIETGFDTAHLSKKLEHVFYRLLDSAPEEPLGIDTTDSLSL